MTAVETPYHRIGIETPAATGNVDLLTGLGNARCLRQTVLDLARERASDPAPFTIGLANIDGFKPINDLRGDEPAGSPHARLRVSYRNRQFGGCSGGSARETQA